MSDGSDSDNFDVDMMGQEFASEESDGSNRINDEVHSGREEDDSDTELQIAFKQGLLQQHGLSMPKIREREPINKRAQMERKFALFHKKRSWLDTLHVSFSPGLCYTGAANDDFEREAAFHKQALSAVQIALPRLASMNVAVSRPTDYFAEMAKSDAQMDRVRRKLMDVQKTKQRRENARRLREERKFAVNVQKSREERKRKEKKRLLEATKKHRKGMKGQLEEMLKNAKRMHADDEDEEPSGAGKFGRKGKGGRAGGGKQMSRKTRDKRYGFGGQKKRSKSNDKKSFDRY